MAYKIYLSFQAKKDHAHCKTSSLAFGYIVQVLHPFLMLVLLQGCTDCGGPEINDSNFVAGKRLFRFWVTDRRGDKLDYQRCTALLYTMGLLLGQNRAPLRPPGTSLSVNGGGNNTPGSL